MKLIPISEHSDAAKILYDLLAERPAEAAISHKAMPSFEEHCAFVASHPYEAWYIIEDQGPTKRGGEKTWFPVGAIYLTPPPRKSVAGNEIGVFIFKVYQGCGAGPQATKLLMEKHGPRRYLANVAPANEASRKMFEKLGFKTVQHTLALEAE